MPLAALLRFDEPHLAWEKLAYARAHALAVAGEIGLVVGKKIGKRGGALAGGVGIEHHADDAQEAIVLDDEGAIGWQQERSEGSRRERLEVES
jgi:hypothetical protein